MMAAKLMINGTQTRLYLYITHMSYDLSTRIYWHSSSPTYRFSDQNP